MIKEYSELENFLINFDPYNYAKTRNFIDGGVSKLSPFISRGVISTKKIAEILTTRGLKKYELEKFFQELAWRDYWQKKWQELIDINKDLKNIQSPIYSYDLPSSITNASINISAVDNAINLLYSSGYMHNHLRMYTASICCNIGNFHWLNPAKWMYFHLLDGDWGSNALSWQWVAGTNSNKKYYANQNNINKYCYSNDKNTFLDYSYEELIKNDNTPEDLKKKVQIKLETKFEVFKTPTINQNLPTYIYTSYNLDPNWENHIPANRILLLEPNHFKEYPISKNVLNFIINQSKLIEDIQVAFLNFDDLFNMIDNKTKIHFKEHPFNNHFKGVSNDRDWLFPNINAEGSFFNYWKKGIKKYQLI